MSEFTLEKDIWTEADFARMSFHDTVVWSMLSDPDRRECFFDIDYIFQWVKPGPGETHFKFWVAPVTLVFENAHSIKIDAEASKGLATILALHREDAQPTGKGTTEQLYTFECVSGEIQLRATGYRMRVRKPPRLVSEQDLGLIMRDGVSFEEAQPLRESDIAALCDKYAGQLRDRAGNDKRVLGASEVRCLLQGPGSSALPLRWKVAMQRCDTVRALETAPHIPGMAAVRGGADNALYCSVELSVPLKVELVGDASGRVVRVELSADYRTHLAKSQHATADKHGEAFYPEWAAFRTDVFVAQVRRNLGARDRVTLEDGRVHVVIWRD